MLKFKRLSRAKILIQLRPILTNQRPRLESKVHHYCLIYVKLEHALRRFHRNLRLENGVTAVIILV